MLQQAALEAVTKQRYRPLMYEGRAVNVWYTFWFHFKLR